MSIVNCTPHAIVLRHTDGPLKGTDTVFAPSGFVPRMTVEVVVNPLISLAGGVPVVKSVFGGVVGLPNPGVDADGNPLIYIVSTMLAQACPHRVDLISPDTGPTAIREGGQVQAVIRFQSFYIGVELPRHMDAKVG